MTATAPPNQPWQAGQPESAGASTNDERTWGAIAHAGSFVAAWLALGILAPLGVLLFRGNSSAFVRHHAVESLNFQINALFWLAVSIPLILLIVGILLLPVIGAWYLVFVILASVRANRGEWYRYPMIFRVIR